MRFSDYKAGKGEISDTMLAWHVYGKGLENVGKNEKPVEIDTYNVGPDNLLARIDAAGLCFSDVKILKQGGEHPRLHGRDLENDPIVMGHEAAITIVEVGDNYEGEYEVGDRFVVQAEIYYKGKNLAFGYMLPGAFEQYTILGPEILQGDDGVYLIPIAEDETGYAEAALSEPWACVLCAYRQRPRTTLKAAGTVWIIGTPGCEDADYDISGFEAAGTFPAKVYLTDVPKGAAGEIKSLCQGAGIAVEETDTFAEFDADDALPDGADDIFVLGSGSATVVEQAAEMLADDGLFNLITDDELERPVDIDVGRIHYDGTFYQGCEEPSVAKSYIQRRGPELTEDGKVLLIGGAGPMGQMHVQLAAEMDNGPRQIVVSDIDPERLDTIPQRFGPIAERNGRELMCVNPEQLGEDGFDRKLRNIAPDGFDDVVVLVPAPPLVTQGAKYLADNGWLNLFAGIARGTTAQLDLSDTALCDVRYTGTSGSSIDDMARALNMAETGKLSTNRSVAAIGGLNAVRKGLGGVMNAVYTGKVVVYPQIEQFPLTPLGELHEVAPQVAEKLDDSGGWTREAERTLLQEYID